MQMLHVTCTTIPALLVSNVNMSFVQVLVLDVNGLQAPGLPRVQSPEDCCVACQLNSAGVRVLILFRSYLCRVALL